MDIDKIKIITGEEIPFELHQIPDPPKKLYTQGELPRKDAKILCIVGARRYSSYGEEITKKLISGLRGYNICIVSGLAHGIDGIAHRSALETGLQTVAFPGSGLHRSVLYPTKHHNLADEILYAHGGLISELDPNHPSIKWTFPRRNRLMAGISHAILIIEARNGSGSGITARLALDYNKEVGAVPGNIDSPLSELPNKLIRDGAIPITCSNDILEMLGFSTPINIPIQMELLLTLSGSKRKIIELLQIESMTTDMFLEKTDLDIQQLNEILSEMEIDNYIKEKSGKFTLV